MVESNDLETPAFFSELHYSWSDDHTFRPSVLLDWRDENDKRRRNKTKNQQEAELAV